MNITSQTVRMSSEQLKSEFLRILLKNGFLLQKAETLANIFATNTIEGVSSHGVNRFPRFIGNVRDGYLIPDAVPSHIFPTGAR